jgi:hypothetical protein
MEWISQITAAKRLKIKRQKIQKWISDGLLKKRSDSKICYEEVLRVYEQGQILDKNAGNGVYDIFDARRAKETWQARLLELDYKKREGELLEKEEVLIFYKHMVAVVKTKILAVADRVPPLIIGDENEKRVRKILRDELIIALDELTKAKAYKK